MLALACVAQAGLACRAPLDEPSLAATTARRPPAPVEAVLVEPPEGGFDGRLALASIFPTLGRYALSGVQSHNGARLAVEELNRAGGLHGRRLRLLTYKTGSYFLDARHAAELAAHEQGALAIVGSNSSSLSRTIAEVAEQVGIVQVSNVSTAADLTYDPASGRDRPFVFRVCSSEHELAARLATFARVHLGAKRVAVLYELGRTYSAQLARAFAERFAQPAQGRVVGEFAYLTLETDFRPQLRAIQAFAPDVLFVPGSFSDSSLIAAQAEAMGLQPTLLGADGWSNKLLFSRGGPRRPAYHADLCAPAPAFAERYRQAFGQDVDGCRAVLAFDAVQAVGAALRSLGALDEHDLRAPGLTLTRARLQAALQRVSLAGESGPLRFDARGDVRRGVVIMRLDRAPDGRYAPGLFRVLGES
jgi:branched-chain amino acid transport system substrate-binding protein